MLNYMYSKVSALNYCSNCLEHLFLFRKFTETSIVLGRRFYCDNLSFENSYFNF